MNKGLLSWPQSQAMQPGLFGLPLGEVFEPPARMPPVGDYMAWYDSWDGADLTVDSSGLVSSWADKGPTGYTMTQGTAGNKPAWGPSAGSRARQINGRYVPDFDGADWLTNAGIPWGEVPVSVVTLQVVDTTGWSTVCGGDANDNSPLLRWQNGGNLHLQDTDEGLGFSSGISRTVGRPTVIGANVTSANALLWKDYSESSGSHGRGFTTVPGCQLGGNNNGNVPFDGAIAEFVFFARELDQEERVAMTDYLLAKWRP